MPRPPDIATLLTRSDIRFAVVKVEPSADVDLPGRFTADVRAADATPLGVFDAVRELDDPRGTWIVTPLGGDLDVLVEGAAVVLAGPDGLELRGLVTTVMPSSTSPDVVGLRQRAAELRALTNAESEPSKEPGLIARMLGRAWPRR